MRSSISQSKQPRTLNRRSLSLMLGLIALALLLLVLDRTQLLAPVKGTIQAWTQPLEGRLTQFRLATGDFVGNIVSIGGQSRRIEELERELAKVRADNLRLQTLQSTNAALTQQLGIQQVYGWRLLAAPVVQINADNGRRMIRIGKGRVDGVRLGMAVVAQEGGNPTALIGTVDNVYAQNADVLLITDGGSSVSARIPAHTPAPRGLVLGQWQSGSRIQLQNIDRDATFAVGDVVVSAGLSKGVASDTPMAYIPADIPIGVITAIKRGNRDQNAEILPFVDPDRVRDVWVITGEIENREQRTEN